MSSFASNLESLKRFSSNLRKLPTVVAQKVATASAPAISAAAVATAAAGQDPYGVPWLPSTRGDRVDLRETGALLAQLRYVAIGTILRVVLGVSYARYQIGRRPVFPRQGAALPADYVRALEQATEKVVTAELAV